MARLLATAARTSFRRKLLCSALAFAIALPPADLLAAAAPAASYAETLQGYLKTDPGHFNDRMWELIRANPQARDQIFNEAVRLSLQHEIAANPAKKAEIIAKFKKLYPQLAANIDAYAEGQTATPVRQVVSFSAERPIRTYADDPTTREAAHTSWMGRNWPWVLLGGVAVGGIVGGVILATSSGSSDDDEAQPLATPPIVGYSREYANQSGLTRINAGAANDAGFTGAGITVAVVDSGVNIAHPDLQGRIAPGGYDYVNNTDNITDTNNDIFGVYHGTHVAGVIAAGKNGFGMRGVAYDAKILPFVAINENANQYSIINSVNRASQLGARVLNASYGPNDLVTVTYVQNEAQLITSYDLDEANAYLNAANNGTVLVFAAGNEYQVDALTPTPHLITNNPTGGGFLPFIRPSNANIALGQPGAYRYADFVSDGHGGILAQNISTLNADYSGLEGHLIVAVALDTNNVIAPFSNRCGVAKDWCIAAPGTAVYSTGAGNTYSSLDGTSFAAPHVSGALAVLMQQHPELTDEQIVNLLLDTATDLGAPGVDDVYGHGLLNLNAAVQAVGPFSIVTGANMSGGGVLLNNSSLRASPVFGASAIKALANTDIGVLDAYTRNFSVKLGGRVATSLTRMDSTVALQRFGQNEFRPEIGLDDKNSVSFTLRPKDGMARAADEVGMTFDSYSFTHRVSDAAAMGVKHGDVRSNALGFNEDDRSLLATQVTGNGVGNPYLDFVGTGYATNMTVDLPWEARFRATTAMGAREEDDEQRNMLTMSEVGFGDAGIGVTLSAGALLEQDRMLGMSGTGAFAFGQGTTTWFGGVAGQWQLAEKTQLLASWYGGVTEAQGAANSLYQGAQRVQTSAWRVGLSQRDVLLENDRLRVNVAQPLRAESGSLNVSMPQYRLRDGTMIRQTVGYQLAPTGREIDFETGYSLTVDERTRMDFAAMYRSDAGHVAGASEAIGMARFNRGF